MLLELMSMEFGDMCQLMITCPRPMESLSGLEVLMILNQNYGSP